ncbi:hypothetical protein D3C75_1058170 [compost metagenome]
MAGKQKPVQLHLLQLQQMPQHRLPPFGRQPHAEVGQAPFFRLHQCRAQHGKGGFEADAEKHHLTAWMGGSQLHRIHGGIHHPDIPSFSPGLQKSAAAARDPHHIAEGANHPVLLTGHGNHGVNVRLIRYAYGTAGP